MTKPITLWSHVAGPNPWKVVIILEELGLSYEPIYLNGQSVKAQPYTDVNPNGRVPAIHDPNTNITVFESGAIIEYLIDQYDSKHTISPSGNNLADIYHAKQWLHFQTSGQGPYFGQATWFARFHPEKLPSAIERYRNEIRRVTSVLDSYLAGTSGSGTGSGTAKEYLVGNKCTYADLAFVPWYVTVTTLLPREGEEAIDLNKDFPHYAAWFKGLLDRPAVKKAFESKKAAAVAEAEAEAKAKEGKEDK